MARARRRRSRATDRGRAGPGRSPAASRGRCSAGSAVRRVEGEDPRLELRQRDAVVGAGEVSEKRSCSPPFPSALSTRSTATSPSASPAAVSIDWVRRRRRSARITSRSTTTSIVCLNFLSSSGTPSSSTYCLPSTLTRVKPSRVRSSKTSLYSPLRSRMIGALTVKRVPSSSFSTWSTIASRLCPAIGLPQIGQCGRPTRA